MNHYQKIRENYQRFSKYLLKIFYISSIIFIFSLFLNSQFNLIKVITGVIAITSFVNSRLLKLLAFWLKDK